MEGPAPTVAAVVREQAGVSWSKAKALCLDGRVTVNGQRCLDPARRIPPGAEVKVDRFAPKLEKGPLQREDILYFDRDIVVVDKPAEMLSVPDVPGNKDTLVDHTRVLLRKIGGREQDAPLGVVHRLDKGTSGVMMFTRNARAQREMAALFEGHDIEREYHAIAHGEVTAGRVESHFLLDRGDGLRGSHGHYRRSADEPPPESRLAITSFVPLEDLAGATLVQCHLETGRQHQIRIHLAERGNPVLGEHVYIRDYQGEKIEAPRTMLHARLLGFVHPSTGKAMSFEREAPGDFRGVLKRLRRRPD